MRVACQRLQDLDPLLLADRQLPDLGRRADLQAVALAERRDLLVHRLVAHAAAATEHDVLGDRERGHQVEVLVHHADPLRQRVARRVHHGALAPEVDRAGVGVVDAGEHVRQRRLAGAVLPEQGVHLAGGDVEVDGVVGDDTARELLRDLPHRDRRRGRSGGGLARE